MARYTRIALDMALEASKRLKPALGNVWQYAKTELVPPLTLNFFHGPKGKNLEERVSKAADNFIAGIKSRIDDIEAEKLREIKRKEAAAKALAEKKKAEAKKKAEEVKKKAEAIAKKAKLEAEKKAQAAASATSEAKQKTKDEKETNKKQKKETKKSPDVVKSKQTAKSCEPKKDCPPKAKK
ncbi:tol-Pal system protein TolA-like [Nymphalis io]|uniref:tol-Pal system protein TolA-like n=1 Tax=Inachis io TaxID=171585 RepID=UPI00216A65EF|nr:tol-Pal system protein TolA-like [Nymphalis io]